ncbi:MAG: hypothetical protein ACXU99_06600 [Thermodesulfobacteriota bacterium]
MLIRKALQGFLQSGPPNAKAALGELSGEVPTDQGYLFASGLLKETSEDRNLLFLVVDPTFFEISTKSLSSIIHSIIYTLHYPLAN